MTTTPTPFIEIREAFAKKWRTRFPEAVEFIEDLPLPEDGPVALSESNAADLRRRVAESTETTRGLSPFFAMK